MKADREAKKSDKAKLLKDVRTFLGMTSKAMAVEMGWRGGAEYTYQKEVGGRGVTQKNMEDLRRVLLDSSMPMSEAEWKARRSELADRVAAFLD